MSTERQRRELRSSYRCAVVDVRQPCALQVGSDLLPAKLLDESAGGFAVLVDRLAGLSVDQTVQLHTDAGWSVVRVVHVAEVAPPEDGDAAADNHDPWFRLGLSRVGDAMSLDQPAVSLLAGGLHFRLSQSRPSSGMPMFVGALMAVVVVAVPVALIGGLWYASQSKAKRLPSSDAPPSEWVTPSDWPQSTPSDDRGSAGGPDSGRTQQSAPSSPMFAQDLSDMIHRLPGATALEMPEVVKQLRLTADQQKKIRRVIESAFEAMRELDVSVQGQERQQTSELRTQLLDQARREAVGLLTTEQRAEWDRLVGKK